jgi:uncharacterized protein
MDAKLVEFVLHHTKHFDESHDFNHACQVYKNAKHIASIEFPFYHDDILQFACLLHDVCDHKYDNTLSKEDLHKFIREHMVDEEKADVVIDIINNISYSQEVKGLRKTVPLPWTIYQDIVSDADKLEALGHVGLERCIAFTKARGGKVPEDVVAHCHEKLLKLKDNFIRTKVGKQLAQEGHKVIEEYVANYS